MSSRNLGAAFVRRISTEAQDSAAVNHPYLCAFREGDFPDFELAVRDFAFQYGLYSSRFVRYVSAVIKNLGNAEHKNILCSNLAEEQGEAHDVGLPADVFASIVGQPHAQLYRRFQEALGVDTRYRETMPQCQTAVLWSRQFLQLCEMNECVGVGAIGIGTELIVSRIYHQILEGLEAHSNLTMTHRVFFDLHSKCDEQHASQMLLIAEDLARNRAACEQLEYGARMAIVLRTLFWDKMLDRARSLAESPVNSEENLYAVGYPESL